MGMGWLGSNLNRIAPSEALGIMQFVNIATFLRSDLFVSLKLL